MVFAEQFPNQQWCLLHKDIRKKIYEKVKTKRHAYRYDKILGQIHEPTKACVPADNIQMSNGHMKPENVWKNYDEMPQRIIA